MSTIKEEDAIEIIDDVELIPLTPGMGIQGVSPRKKAPKRAIFQDSALALKVKGFDPILKLIDVYHQAEAAFQADLQSPKPSKMAQSALLNVKKSIAETLLPYAYVKPTSADVRDEEEGNGPLEIVLTLKNNSTEDSN